MRRRETSAGRRFFLTITVTTGSSVSLPLRRRKPTATPVTLSSCLNSSKRRSPARASRAPIPESIALINQPPTTGVAPLLCMIASPSIHIPAS